MKQETKNCQNCKKDFVIEAEDFNFYEKIKVPPPTFCPECRFVRRMIWRNERSLYKRKCDVCDKSIISMYDDKVPFPIYCPECYKSDQWEASKFSLDYDFSKSFFAQWKKLFNIVPRQSLQQNNNIKSEYSNYSDSSKNVYMGFSVLTNCEFVYYSSNINNSKQIVDSYNITDGELVFNNIGSYKNYNTQYSYWSSSCISCNFILNCNNCQNCFSCVNLVNKNYCIFNEQYTKEEYEKKMKEIDLGKYSSIKILAKEFWDFSIKFPRKYANIINCINSTGDELRNNKNTKYCFNVSDSENVKYGYRSPRIKDSMDVGHSWASNVYEHALSGSENSQNLKFIINGNGFSNEIEYTDSCKYCTNIFGCIGLKNKQYCILNKQYGKKEYFELVDKIKQQMMNVPYIDKIGRIYNYGEFFPTELCPFGYNETVINDHFPLTKEEIIEKGYLYKDKEVNKYDVTLKAKNIPDNIKDINNSILDEVIECEKSGRAFKITEFELQFYRRMNIPIPRLHPDERHKERMGLRNPMKLWHRECMRDKTNHANHQKGKCEVEFETSYAPERSEIVYCEKCYQQEVY